MIYNKLVRDKIPEIMEESGKNATFRQLSQAEYFPYLETKLDEEVGEYHADHTLEELADILEVVYALAAAQGCTKEELLAVYDRKHAQRGGFEKRLLLMKAERRE